MNFSMSRPPGERFVAPRRKPAPSGVITAVQETLKGTLDAVMDGSRYVVHAPIARTPASRNLTESNPDVRRRPSRHIDLRNGPPAAAISHLTTATLTGGFANSPVRLLRGKKIVIPSVSDAAPQALPASQASLRGKRHFDPTSSVAGAPLIAAPSKVTAPPFASETSTRHAPPPPPPPAVLHKRVVRTAPTDTPGILRFSPRVRIATTSCIASNAPTVRATKAVAPMRSILSWSGATPRYTGHRQSAVSRTIQPPSETTTKTATTAPYDAPFSTAAAARLDTRPFHAQSGRRPRGTGKVDTRPKSARGLLSWTS